VSMHVQSSEQSEHICESKAKGVTSFGDIDALKLPDELRPRAQRADGPTKPN
jgi:hypothetical protein